MAQRRRKKTTKKAAMQLYVGDTILCQFKRPTKGADAAKDHLKSILQRKPKKIDGKDIFHLAASWWGSQHNGSIYYEPADELLNLGIDVLYYYMNNIHQQLPEFSVWWTSVCRPPANELALNELVKVAGDGAVTYIKVLDVLDVDKCWIYNDYEHCIIGSGKEFDINSGEIVGEAIVFIRDNHEITHFIDLHAVKSHLMSYSAEESFIGHLVGGTMGKIRVPMKSAAVFKDWQQVWLIYLRAKLQEKGIEYQDNKISIKFKVSNAKAIESFDLVEFKKENKAYQFFNEKIEISIFKKTKRKKRANANGNYNIIGSGLL